MYFPQPNNGVLSFGRDVNIRWKHGINALPAEEQDGKGRISIILWGLVKDVVEEEGSPTLLGADGNGPHAAKNNHRYGRNRNNKGGRNGGGGKKPGNNNNNNNNNGKEAPKQ